VTVAAVRNGRYTGYDTSSGDVRWTIDSPGSPGATPGLAGDTVFVGAGAEVRALDPRDGANRWTFAVAGQLSAGAMDNELVVVSAVTDGPVETYALDRSTGALRWHTHVGATSSVVWATTTSAVVLMNAPNTLYGLDRNGNQIWELNVPGDQNSPPVIDGDEIYFTANDYGVYAVDARTGHVDWVRKVGSFTGGRPLVANGMVVTFAGIFDPPRTPAIVAIDATTGAERWRTPFAPENSGVDSGSEPLIKDDILYVGYGVGDDASGGVIALDPATGTLLGALSIDFKIQRTLAIDGSHLYVRAGDMSIAAVPLPLPRPA
jgi:outer membrane protein assembly factor BamB